MNKYQSSDAVTLQKLNSLTIARLVLRVLESISVSKVNQYFRFFFFGNKKKNYTVGEKKTQHLCGSLELLLTFYLFHQIVLRTTRWKNCVFFFKLWSYFDRNDGTPRAHTTREYLIGVVNRHLSIITKMHWNGFLIFCPTTPPNRPFVCSSVINRRLFCSTWR